MQLMLGSFPVTTALHSARSPQPVHKPGFKPRTLRCFKSLRYSDQGMVEGGRLRARAGPSDAFVLDFDGNFEVLG